MNRRDFLRFAAASAVGTTLPLPALASSMPTTLWIARNNPSEGLLLDLSSPTGIGHLHYLLRDIRANRQGFVHPQLVQTLLWLQAWLQHWGLHSPIVATSGLRVEHTNRTVGGARQSQHLPDENGVFRAIDFHIPGAHTGDLARMLEWAQTGGVGLYLASNHIHLDAGQPRSWGIPQYQ